MADTKVTKVKPAPIMEVLGVRILGRPHVSQNTGSIGFNFNQSIVDSDGVKYQLTANLTLTGTSKDSKGATAEQVAEAEARAEAATKAAEAKASARK